jgi:hypothetical protein
MKLVTTLAYALILTSLAGEALACCGYSPGIYSFYNRRESPHPNWGGYPGYRYSPYGYGRWSRGYWSPRGFGRTPGYGFSFNPQNPYGW